MATNVTLSALPTSNPKISLHLTSMTASHSAGAVWGNRYSPDILVFQSVQSVLINLAAFHDQIEVFMRVGDEIDIFQWVAIYED